MDEKQKMSLFVSGKMFIVLAVRAQGQGKSKEQFDS
jgi:hypothetical protein